MTEKWSVSVRVFHWLSALLLLVTWASIELSHNVAVHKSFGVSLLFWMLARLINRIFISKVPPHLPAVRWQVITAKIIHFFLYTLLFAMPIAGILMSVYGAKAISVFGVFEIPVFVTPNREFSKFFRKLHEDVIWLLLIVFTALHIAGAFYNQFILKNNVIARMR